MDVFDFIDIPSELLEAERLLHSYFAKNGMDSWVFGSLCSRNHYEKLVAIEKILNKENKYVDFDE